MNPFKVGDKVRLKKSSYDFNPIFWRAYDGYECAIVTGVYDAQIATDLEGKATHYTHFEFYKEEKDMTQQAQQKTKRVPFSEEVWYKHKNGKVVWLPSQAEILYFREYPLMGCTFIGVYKARGSDEYVAVTFMKADYTNMSLEIPVTIKRILFNPELKDAKVFIEGDMLFFNTEIKEWHLFSNDFVALLDYEDNVRIKHRSKVQMEIEEDV